MKKTFVIIVLFCSVGLYFYHESVFHELEVDGWGRDVSLDIPRYVNPDVHTTFLAEKNFCSNTHVLIVVCSRVEAFTLRSAIRSTWASEKSTQYRIVFLLGLAMNGFLQEVVEMEAAVYSDLIQEQVLDTYYNLTLKSVMMLKMVVHNCRNVTYLVKCDDDSFVYLPNLISFINNITSNDVLAGTLYRDVEPIRLSDSKWYAPYYLFNEPKYPPYLSGSLYLMDISVAMRIYEVALQTPYFHLEDVFVTGICARKANITPMGSELFRYKTASADPCHFLSGKISRHRTTPSQMTTLWTTLKNGTAKCEEPMQKIDKF